MSAPATRTDNGSKQNGVTGRYLAVLKAGVGKSVNNVLHQKAGLRSTFAALDAPHARTAPNESVVFRNLGIALIDATPEQVGRLETDSDSPFWSVEPERRFKLIQPPPQDVPCKVIESDETWGVRETGAAFSKHTGRGTRVCVLDSGIDAGHPDFEGRVACVRSFVPDETPHDTLGHGTHCAGTVCGPRQPKSAPRYGVAPDASLMVGKVFDQIGESCDGYVLAGIEWALALRCDVVSMSLGELVSPDASFSPAYEQMASRALECGTLLIAAAGNNSSRMGGVIRPVVEPANSPSIMAVSALDSCLEVASTANGGLSPNGGAVDLAAPGVDILSAWTRNAGVLYSRKDGTSMAAPFVSGIALLYAEAVPCARGAVLWKLLLDNVKPLGLSVRDVGAGLVRAAGSD